jgi:maleamate amidohydrolase
LSDAWNEETGELYRRRGFGTRIGWGERPALIVIDMSRAFCDPSYKVGSDQTPTLDAIAELLAAARNARTPVYYTTTAYLPDGRDGGVFVEKIPPLLELQLDDPATSEFPAQIAPADDDTIVQKKYPSAFFGTSLAPMLAARGIDTVILTGCTTSGCVRATAIDAVSSGYRVIVPEEAVSDRAPGPHAANLFDIDAKYGDVVPLADAVGHLVSLVEEHAVRS